LQGVREQRARLAEHPDCLRAIEECREQTAMNALKRQLLQFSDIAER
jgi:hypothetical protein